MLSVRFLDHYVILAYTYRLTKEGVKKYVNRRRSSQTSESCEGPSFA